MFKSENQQKNGDGATRARYLSRLSVVLSDGPTSAGSQEVCAFAPEPAEPAAPGLNDQRYDEAPAAFSDHTDAEQGELCHPGRVRLDQVAEQIAEGLTGILAQTAKGLQARAENDRATLAAIAESVARVSEEILQIRTEGVSGLEARLLALSERVEDLDGSLRTQRETVCELASFCSKLEQTQRLQEERWDSHERALRMLEEEFRQRGGVLERIAGAFRNFDLRRERRFQVEKAVTVVALGEQDVVTAGHVVDASESGLGLVLEAPVPVGAEVRVEVDGTMISGRVTHCRSHDDKFAAGLGSVRQLDAPADGGS